MSALAGIWQWNGEPIEPADLALLATYSRAAGPDGGGTARPKPAVALQAHILRFDARSAVEHQPYDIGDGSVLTWDGRLDNRDDLVLTLHHTLGPERSDAALVAAAYARWGLDVMPKLLGDWSLAIWDAQRRAVILACDYMGNRPLYYYATPARLVWATRLEALAACCRLFTEPEEAYIAGVLTGDLMPAEITPFEKARRLRAGHQFVATRHGDEPRRYWTFAPATVRVPNLAAYADQLRALLTEAVRVRLRAERCVWTHLSGGWDSSSITCLAHVLTHCGLGEAPRVQPVSLVYPHAPESDEAPFISAVERWLGIRTERVPYTRHPTCVDRLGLLVADEGYMFRWMEAPLQAARDRIVLSGELGDMVMGRSGTHAFALLEPLHAGHPLSFLRLAAVRSRHERRPLLRTLGRLSFEAYAPASLRHARNQRRKQAAKAPMLRGINPALLIQFPPTQPADVPSVAGFPVATRALVKGLYRQADKRRLTSPDVDPPVWRTYPYAHRPLVEFVLAAPLQALWEPTITRAGMRRALATILPPEILARTGKGALNTAFARLEPDRTTDLATTDLLPADAANWQVVRRGYVEREALAGALGEVRAGLTASGLLQNSVAVEIWLTTLKGHPAATSPRPPAETAAAPPHNASSRAHP